MPRDPLASENADRCGTWRPIGGVIADLLPAIAGRAISFHEKRARDNRLAAAEREAAAAQATAIKAWRAAYEERQA